MDFFLRWGNYEVAKMLEFLFNTTSLSDVGCTYRLIKRKALEALQPLFRVKGNFFGPEMMLLAAVTGVPMVQIPVNYCPRIREQHGNWRSYQSHQARLQDDLADPGFSRQHVDPGRLLLGPVSGHEADSVRSHGAPPG